MKKNDIPAFPKQGEMDQFSNVFHRPQLGMTLRDYFAGQALAGMLSSCSEGATYSPMNAAGNAYEFADAMLAERDGI
jgi:hypothetical protein